MNSGVPPTPRNARTGEFTPPTRDRPARSNRASDFARLLTAASSRTRRDSVVPVSHGHAVGRTDDDVRPADGRIGGPVVADGPQLAGLGGEADVQVDGARGELVAAAVVRGVRFEALD